MKKIKIIILVAIIILSIFNIVSNKKIAKSNYQNENIVFNQEEIIDKEVNIIETTKENKTVENITDENKEAKEITKKDKIVKYNEEQNKKILENNKDNGQNDVENKMETQSSKEERAEIKEYTKEKDNDITEKQKTHIIKVITKATQNFIEEEIEAIKKEGE